MKKILLTGILAISTIGLQSCLVVSRGRNHVTYNYSTTINGNGTIHTSERQTGTFEGVTVNGPFQIIFNDGLAEGVVKIEADENLLPYIKTTVNDGLLSVYTDSNTEIQGFTVLKVYVSK